MTEKKQNSYQVTEDEAATTAPLFLSCRLMVTILMFFACLITYVLRLNMGFAMVCMVKKKPYMSHMLDFNGTSESDFVEDDCGDLSSHDHGNETEVEMGEFTWEKSLQGTLNGGFFYGYIVTQVPAGWLCRKIGGKKVLAVGLGVVSFLTLLLPEAGRISPFLMLAVRIIQGMFGAVSFPAIHTIVSNWAPPRELGLLMSIAYSGMYLGTVLTFPICGLLCKYGFAGGWPSVFYVTGMMGLVWVIAAMFLVFDGADYHPRITTTEKLYLEKNMQQGGHATGKVPWKDILTSPAQWAITIAHLCANWGLYTLVINLPLYMKEVLKFDIKQNGFLSALPYLCTLIVNLFCGRLSDFIRRRKLMSHTAMRKSFNTVGMVIPFSCMVAITFLGCQERYVVVGLLTLCQASSGFAYSGGFFYNHVDIAPQYAGILMGISNMFGTISGIIPPVLVGLLTPHGSRDEWVVVFYIGAVMYAVGCLTYLLIGSGEIQPWAINEDSKAANDGAIKPLTNADKDKTSSV